MGRRDGLDASWRNGAARHPLSRGPWLREKAYAQDVLLYDDFSRVSALAGNRAVNIRQQGGDTVTTEFYAGRAGGLPGMGQIVSARPCARLWPLSLLVSPVLVTARGSGHGVSPWRRGCVRRRKKNALLKKTDCLRDPVSRLAQEAGATSRFMARRAVESSTFARDDAPGRSEDFPARFP